MIEHWLLDLAVEFPVWLVDLFPVVNTEGLNVKPVPKCNTVDYARALVELADSGAIMLSSKVPEDDVHTPQGVRAILDRFVTLRQHGPLLPLYERTRLPGMHVSFKLTSRGGETWESVAEPNWSDILTVSVDDKSGESCSPNRHLLMAYLGWYGEIEDRQIEPQTIRLETHSNFQILYWKRLPLVHRATFELKPAIPQPFRRTPQWFNEWYRSAIAWRKKPWDLPGWPA
jgi:hypothetical protein